MKYSAVRCTRAIEKEEENRRKEKKRGCRDARVRADVAGDADARAPGAFSTDTSVRLALSASGARGPAATMPSSEAEAVRVYVSSCISHQLVHRKRIVVSLELSN